MSKGAAKGSSSIAFRLIVQSLLNVEHFFQRKFNKIKNKYLSEIGAHS
jgi:hypothetical protein